MHWMNLRLRVLGDRILRSTESVIPLMGSARFSELVYSQKFVGSGEVWLN